MFVKLNFSQSKKRESTKKRKRLSADRKRKKIQKLKCENENLRRNTMRFYKRIQGKKQRKTEGFSPNLPETSPSEIQNEPFTPKRKVDSEIREAGVSPGVIPGDQQAIRNVISGSTVKKYREMKTLSEMTMTDRRKLAKVKAKSIKICNIRKKPLIEKGVQAKVIDFFKRDDNSRMMPGEKDVKRIEKDGPRIQNRILHDYLSNLCEKFITEYPEDPLSFSSFCHMRPPGICKSTLRQEMHVCACTRHQNVA